jgi:hypothetical protein
LGCPTRPIRNVGVAPPLAPPASIRDSPRPYVIRPLGQGSIFSSSRIAVRLRPCAEQYRSNVRSTQCRFWSRESGGHGTGALTKADASVPPLSRLPREKVSRSAEHIFPICFHRCGSSVRRTSTAYYVNPTGDLSIGRLSFLRLVLRPWIRFRSPFSLS